MEVHDSRLLEVHQDDSGSGYALFHAYIYRGEDKIFEQTNYESGWQNLRFDFEGMRVEGTVDLMQSPYASDGDLWVNGQNTNGIIYLPSDHIGTICLKMQLSPDFDSFKIHGSKITSTLEGTFCLEHKWNEDGPIIIST